MRLLHRVRALVGALRRSKRNRAELPRWLARRPALLASTAVGELALLTQNRADPRLKTLAGTKAAALVSCEYCLDISAALAKADGLTPQHLVDLPRFEESDVYTELEVLVLRLTTCMSRTPAYVPPELRDALIARVGKAAYVELAFEVAWEHKRGRFYQALGLQPTGIADGLTCPIPEGVPARAQA